MIDAHPEVEIAFEPYAAQSQNTNVVPPFQSIEHFMADMPRFAANARQASILGMKNTTGPRGETDWVEETLNNLSKEVPVVMAVIVRDPVESYLSHVEGNRRWWGKPDDSEDHGMLPNVFKTFMSDMHRLKHLLTTYGGCLFTYGAFVTEPTTIIEAVMGSLGLQFAPVQLNFHSLGRHSKYWGDEDVHHNPEPISVSKYLRRRQQAFEFLAQSAELAESELSQQTQTSLKEIEEAKVLSFPTLGAADDSC